MKIRIKNSIKRVAQCPVLLISLALWGPVRADTADDIYLVAIYAGCQAALQEEVTLPKAETARLRAIRIYKQGCLKEGGSRFRSAQNRVNKPTPYEALTEAVISGCAVGFDRLHIANTLENIATCNIRAKKMLAR